MQARGSLTLFFALTTLVACGHSSDAPDASHVDAPGFMLCGNFMVEGTEECDDGNHDSDDGCSADCTIECGDGVLSGAELCDPGITSGDPGACPTDAECTDDDPCTSGVVSGSGCEVVCEFATNTATIDGDGCCPTGADATTDDDCAGVCGNGVLEPPELCDTTIPSDHGGACPTTCNDGQLCTADALINAGTCAAACTATPITEIGPADGCCPAGGTPGTDGDCHAGCGDGNVTGTETCDTGIPTGVGSCPTACNDGNACTTDTLANAGTCNAACVTAPIGPGPSDGCCPLGSDLGDDPDCPPSCGDGVITPPETCDDNNDDGGDGCSATCRREPIGFRLSDMDLRDPHTFATVPLFNCTDVTNFDFLGNKGVNPTLQIKMQGDAEPDGKLDLSLAQTFLPLIQTASSTSDTDIVLPDCTAPMSSTSCVLPAGAPHTPATATNSGGGAVCLDVVSGTVNTGYTPALVKPTAPPSGGTCYAANVGTFTFSLGQIPITLIDTRVAGEWFGTPATEIRDGMIRGFLTETIADATIIPPGTTGIASIDGHPVSSLLRGGTGNCDTPHTMTGDRDTYTPPGGTAQSGWYFYLNFGAAKVPYTEQ